MPSFEQKYCIGTNDGKYQILWDISAMLKDLKNGLFPTEKISVSELTEKNGFYGDRDYAMTTDTEKPCIIAELCGGVQKLIDGSHRLYKANQLSLETVPCYVLPLDYHKKFIIDYNAETYEKVVAEFRYVTGNQN